ncbi:MAG: tocopherol cyclase family protein [Mariniphaga sp.]
MKTPFKVLFLLVLICFLSFNDLQAQSEESWSNFSTHTILPGYGLRKVSHPEIFQGNQKRKKYFEGWYFKMVSKDGSFILSVIPGISLSGDGKEQHAFIQIIDGKTAKTDYYPFPIGEFSFSKKRFAIKIGQNYFSKDKIILNIQTDSSFVSGEIRMSEQVALSSPKIVNPGIMGWYRFVPFMQCYHGVVSLTHSLDGNLVKDGKQYNFNNGRGYIEKDWGSSMPSAWIWIQSNNFNKVNSSFMLSIANVPWLGKPFTGFLGFFLCDSTLYRFATYTHAKLHLEETGTDTTKITVKDRKNTYSIVAVRNNSGLLRAPVKGSMDRRIAESIDAKLHLTVSDRKGNIIFDDSTSIAGFEKVGDQEILKGVKKKRK